MNVQRDQQFLSTVERRGRRNTNPLEMGTFDQSHNKGEDNQAFYTK